MLAQFIIIEDRPCDENRRSHRYHCKSSIDPLVFGIRVFSVLAILLLRIFQHVGEIRSVVLQHRGVHQTGLLLLFRLQILD